MATRVKATNANILRAARNSMSRELQAHLPDEIMDNLQTVFDTIMNNQNLRNEIIPSLIQRIGLQTVDAESWDNPLALYKKDPMRYGATHEETYVNMARGKKYNPRESFEYIFKQYQSYIMTAFHNVNVKVQYPVTITFNNLRDAFLSEYGIKSMMDAKLQSAITGANWDEYTAMKGLIDTGYDKEYLPAITVPEVVDEASAKKLLVEVKAAVNEFKFPNPANNIAGATSSSRAENLIWITTPRADANISVEALAYAFNMDKAQVSIRTVIVDRFENPAIQGVLVDARFFNVREQLREFSEQKLANILSWNYFYTLFEMISPTPFYPIRVFTTDVVTQTATITATDGNYVPSTITNIEATIANADGDTGTYLQKAIDYEIESGATSLDTYILPGTNQLVTGADETGNIVISIKWRYDTNPTENVTITMTKAGA